MQKVYISGPITNNPNYELQFLAREEKLRELGYAVCNPVTLGNNLQKRIHRQPTYSEYMKNCIEAELTCDLISFLEGSETSAGSMLEKNVAEACGIPTLKINMLSKGW